MQSSKFMAMMACAVAMFTAAPIARSDGPCNKGFRDSTPAERATMTAALQAAKSALPSASAGWVIVGDDQISVPRSICRDYENFPWRYEFTRYYQRVDDQAARNKIIADAAANAAADFKQKQPRLDAVMARIRKLTQTQVALVGKGDIAGAQAINVDKAKAQADYRKIMDDGDSAEQMAIADKKASRDLTMYIDVLVNSEQETPDGSAKSLPPPAGARAAFRWSTTRGNVSEDYALILLGQWQSTTEGSWNRVRHPNMPPTAAQAISIHIKADPERLASTIGSIDVKSLATKVPN
jgi:hypothetical protein